ncbi:MAG: hypothetical protein KIT45_13150 [Fimbriimonadia bacterium]|nr:hypothetical protein [Fimbriimonadia bacterium]
MLEPRTKEAMQPVPVEQDPNRSMFEEGEETPGKPIRARAILAAFLLLPFGNYWAAEMISSVIFSLMIPPIAILMVVALVNAIGHKATRRWMFNTADMVVIFSVLFVGVAIAAEWMSVITPYWHSFGYYGPRNETYRVSILPYLTDWLFFKTPDGLDDYALGGFGLWYTVSQLWLWSKLIVGWTALLCSAAIAMLCINSLMRDLWTRRERLAFPILQVPMVLCRPESPIWKSRYLWGAFAVMFIIDSVNALSYFYPSIPPIKVRFVARLNEYLTTPPWNQIGWIPVGVFPFLSAIGVFVPNDLLFSCILFYFVRKFMQVGTAAMGYEQGVFGGGGLVPQPPYFSEQSWGAFLGLFVSITWASRAYLRDLWGQIKSGQSPGGWRVMSARWAFIGLILSLATLVGIGVAVGLPWWLVTIYVSLYMMFSIVVARLRAQLGAPIHEMAFMGPHQIMIAFTGTQNLTEGTITRLMTTFHFMNRLHRTHPMPFQLEAIKMGEMVKINQKGLFFVILAATVVGCVIGMVFNIGRVYHDGAGDLGGGMVGVIKQLSQNRYPPNLTAMSFFTGAFCFVMLLDFIRYRIPGFPVHPAGYALSMNFGIDYIWFGLFVVLLIKLFVNRYYGLPGYEKLRAAAIGVILGEISVDLLMAIYHLSTDQAVYTISINGMLGWDQ